MRKWIFTARLAGKTTNQEGDKENQTKHVLPNHFKQIATVLGDWSLRSRRFWNPSQCMSSLENCTLKLQETWVLPNHNRCRKTDD